MEAPKAASRVRVNAGGNYLVRGVTLHDDAGDPIEVGPAYSLCRCGGSSTKPFCDDTHEQLGFTGEETAPRGEYAARMRDYLGAHITVHDDRSICSRAAKCRLGTVFRPGSSPWIYPDDDAAEEVTRVVWTCPSGALTYSIEPAGALVESDNTEPAITVRKNGPYELRGPIEVRSADGETYETRARAVLCRCGASKIMPYCDGSHLDIGFEAD